MKPSDFQKTVQCRFESCLKKVVRHVVKDYQKKLKRRQKEETLCSCCMGTVHRKTVRVHGFYRQALSEPCSDHPALGR